MSIAKVIEISAVSTESFEDAIDQGIAMASDSFDNVSGAWIKEQKVKIKKGRIKEYNVNMQLTVVMGEAEEERVRPRSRSARRDMRELEDEVA